MSLMDKMKKAVKNKQAESLAITTIYDYEPIVSDVPMLNVAYSGDVDGGLYPGVHTTAGESGVFKTNYGLLTMKAFQNQFPDGITLYFDSEAGATRKYFENFGIDTEKVLHIPIDNVEQLKFELVSALEEIEKGEKVFIFVDSIGNLASKKELEDAIDGKSVADMSRAKAIKSLYRIITPMINNKGIYTYFIAHTYKSQSFIPTDIISGGTGILYSSDSAWIVTRAKEKDGSDVIGFKFTIRAEKSRTIKKDSKIPIIATYEEGVLPYSGLADVAVALKVIEKVHGGYKFVDQEGNEHKIKGKVVDRKESKEFWDLVFEQTDLKEKIKKVYQI